MEKITMKTFFNKYQIIIFFALTFIFSLLGSISLWQHQTTPSIGTTTSEKK